jgi:ABC-type uncharacterized transport system involved in gliding motility auxiliary subunit
MQTWVNHVYRPITITLQLYDLYSVTVTITKSTITNTNTITLSLYYQLFMQNSEQTINIVTFQPASTGELSYK